MTITNGYASLTEFKNWARITSSSSDDDLMIELLIESASRYIDTEAQRVFYQSASDVHYFDMPTGNAPLFLDADFTSISGITNGDGSTLSSSDYVTLPANAVPKYAVRLVPTSGAVWKTANGNPFQCIQVKGTTGESCPTDIKEACLMIAKNAYNRRSGQNQTSITTVTAGGLVITPEDVPAKALQMIYNHRRVTFG